MAVQFSVVVPLMMGRVVLVAIAVKGRDENRICHGGLTWKWGGAGVVGRQATRWTNDADDVLEGSDKSETRLKLFYSSRDLMLDKN